MFRFFFKKNSWDIWDNLFHVIFFNLFTLVFVVGAFFLYSWVLNFNAPDGIKNLMFFGLTLICSIILSIVIFTEGENAAKIADFNSPSIPGYFKNIGKNIKDGIVFGIFVTFLIFIATKTVPFYYQCYKPADGSQGSIIFLLLAALVFWFLVITVLALQYFLAIRSLLGNSFFKCLKKSYILFFDNTGFTLGLALVNMLNIVLTFVTIGFAPGITGITITNTNALRLRMYKYDWYEVNPDLSPKERKQVPWAALLEKDKKTLGPRKLRNIFKPWGN